MSNAMDVIKEYLVGIGFSVSEPSFQKATGIMATFEKRVEGLASSFGVMGKAATIMGGLIASAVIGTGKFLDGLGKQEIQMEMLSRQLWTTQQTAQSFSLTLKAMHANIQELYLSPTLMAQYQQLFALAQQMSPNTGSYDTQIRKVQAISLEFKQMRLEMSYAAQWFGMNFIKDMAGPISTVNKKLQEFNDTIIKNLPNWTAKVASVAAGFFKSFSLIGNAVGDAFHMLQELGNYLPTWVKVVGGAFAAIAVLMASNPFFLGIEAISAFLLLMDDYYVWSKGGKSELGGLWASLTNGINKFKAAMQSTGADQSLANMLATLKSDLDGIQTGFDSLGNGLKSGGATSTAFTNFANLIKTIADGLNSILKLIGQVEAQFKSLNQKQNPNGSYGTPGKPNYVPPLNSSKGFNIETPAWYAQYYLQKIIDGVWNTVSGSNATWTPGDRMLWNSFHPGTAMPSSTTHVSIQQSNTFTGSGSSADTLNNLNQANSLMMRGFRGAIQ